METQGCAELENASVAGYQVRPWRPGDEAAILDAFNRTFPTRRTLAEWNRIYADSPDGAEIMLCVAPNGEVAAHYAATVHRALCNGKEVRLGVMRDTFSVAGHRGVRGGRRGLVASTYDAFVRRWTGSGRIAFGFGVANPRHARIGRLQMRYRPFAQWWRGQCLLAGDGAARSMTTPLTVREVSRFDSGFDQLWEQTTTRYPFAVIHDSRFLTWRFAESASRRYWAFACSPFLASQLNGYLIFRPHGDLAWLVDFHLPPEFAAASAFWQTVTARLRARGIRRIEGWCASVAPDLPTLLRLGFQPLPLDGQTCPLFRCFDPQLDPEWAETHFHFTMADSDLV